MIKRFQKRLKRGLARRLIGDAPYRFLIRDWEKINDLELAVRVLETAFFRDQLEPIPVGFQADQKLLLLAPHQDDEAIGAGGSVVLAAKAGAEVHVLYVTDGSQSNLGVGIEESIDIRRTEAKKACALIPATYHELGISNVSPDPGSSDLKDLATLVQQIRPDILLTPWLLDAPVKHRMVNHLLWLAHSQHELPIGEIWGYQVHNTLFPNVYVDITKAMPVKREMLACFASQNEHFQRFDHLSEGLSAWNTRFAPSTDARYLEIFMAVPPEEHFSLIERFYNAFPEQVYRGQPDLGERMFALQKRIAS